MIGRDPSTLSIVEDLYFALTGLLFDEEKLADALIFSEKGRQQLLVALRPELELIDEDRRNYYDETFQLFQSIFVGGRSGISR